MLNHQKVIALPPYTFGVRLAQIILAVLVLILNVVSIAILGGYGALGYGVYTPLATCVIVAYWYHANYRRQAAYNRWVILILDCFAVIWWLSLWSVLAQWAAALGLVDSVENTYGGSDLGKIKVVYGMTAFAAVLGAAEFVLFVVSLVTYSIRLHAARCIERQNMHGAPLVNPTYQQMNDGPMIRQEGVGPKGGFEASV